MLVSEIQPIAESMMLPCHPDFGNEASQVPLNV